VHNKIGWYYFDITTNTKMHKLDCVVAKSIFRLVNAHSTLTKQYYSCSDILRTLPSSKLDQPICLVRLTVVLSRILRCKDMLSPYRIPFPSRNVCICISYTHCSQMRTGLSCSKYLDRSMVAQVFYSRLQINVIK
jgi:hypothetical protein